MIDKKSLSERDIYNKLEASLQQSVSLNEKLLQMVLREALQGGEEREMKTGNR